MARKKNTIGSKGKKSGGSTKKRSSAKRNAGTQPTEGPGFIDKVAAFVRNKRTHKVFGALLILLSLYLFIAFSSYMMTWKSDHDKVFGHSIWSFMFNSGDVSVDNWLGKLGAIVSHVFIYNYFGVASFAFVFMFFLLGVRIATGIAILPVWRSLQISFIFMVWLSIFFGFIASKTNLYLGGSFGFYSAEWLVNSTGNIGTFLLLGLLLFAAIVIFFNPSWDMSWLKLPKRPVAEAEEAVQESQEKNSSNTITPTPAEETPEEEPEPVESEKEPVEFDPAPPVEDTEETVEATTETEVQIDEEFTVTAAAGEEEVDDEELNAKKEDFGEYDPTLDLSSYSLPSVDLLEPHGSSSISVNKEELEQNKNNIVQTLSNYKIEISKITATIGPTVTLYEIVPAPGVRISKIKNLEDDIALSLAALGIRIIAPIPGKGTIGIEVPNSNPDIVSMRSLIAGEKFQRSDMELPVAMGKTISNETFLFDLTKMPHLLMAGATGQGKSVGLNAILVSILYKKHPSQVKFVLVDPKKVELTLFNKIERHFLAKLPGEEKAIITDTTKVVHTLNSLCIEMDDRYALLEEAHCRNIKEYNKKFVARKLNPEKGHRYLPYIVLVIDEFADLIMTAGKEVEQPIARLAQLARAIGIHLIIATQRPAVNIITGTIKANFPARIAFRVISKVDSRTILDGSGADQLIGRGDMLLSTGKEFIRLQCGFVDTPEVESITDFIGSQRAYPEAYQLPEYIDENEGGDGPIDDGDRDALFEDAAHIIVTHQQGSASLLQRKLKIGYNRAGRLIDQLELAGIIGPFKGSKAREVLIPDSMSLEQFLKNGEGSTD